MAAAATACVLLLGISAWAAGGFPARYTKQELAVAGYMGYDPHENWRVGRCFLDGKSSWKFAPECLATAADRKNYLLLGDSHAAQLWSGLRSTYPQVNFLEATAADCFPTIVHSLSEAPRCSRVMDGVLLEFVPHAPLDRVVLIARWKSGLLGNVAATLEWLKQRHIPVTLVGPSAVFDAPLPRLLVNAMRSSDPDLLQHHLNAEMPALDLEMAQLARAHGVPYVSLITQQCPQGPQSCSVRDAGGWPLISDREHFTGEGSALMARRLGPQLQLPP